MVKKRTTACGRTKKINTNSCDEVNATKQRNLDEKIANARLEQAKDMHFVPTALVLTTLICSGILATMAYRDMFSTGKTIFGKNDAAMLHFTGSIKWFDDSKGWKSSQGGFSAVKRVTTDDNDMGGLFIRKAAGALSLAFHLQKFIPLVLQRSNVHWGAGHLDPLLFSSLLGNTAIASFYVSSLDDFKSAGAEGMGIAITMILIVEAVVMAGYLVASCFSNSSRKKVKSLTPGKGVKSVVSNIVLRTIFIISSPMILISGRDFFSPGVELPFPPYDDIYLEWTGAFLHSPPADSAEAQEYGMEAPLHIGTKFISQLMAIHMLVCCFQKLCASYFIRIGKDDSGEIKCKIFWQGQALGDALLLFVFRVFAPAALSASLDLRWHIMVIGYELFILGIYGFF